MKYLIALLILFYLTHCKMEDENLEPKTNKFTKISDEYDNLLGCYVKVLEYDSCEYIYVSGGNAGWGTHKGNCKNPIHHK